MEETARVDESHQRFDSVVTQAIEYIEVHLPGALQFVGGAVTTKVIDLLYEHAKGRLQTQPGTRRTLVICGPDGKPARTFEVDDSPKK